MSAFDAFLKAAKDVEQPQAPLTPTPPQDVTSGFNVYLERAEAAPARTLRAQYTAAQTALADRIQWDTEQWAKIKDNVTPEVAAGIRHLSETQGLPLFDASREHAQALLDQEDMLGKARLLRDNRGLLRALNERLLSPAEFWNDAVSLGAAEGLYEGYKQLGQSFITDPARSAGGGALHFVDLTIQGIGGLVGTAERSVARVLHDVGFPIDPNREFAAEQLYDFVLGDVSAQYIPPIAQAVGAPTDRQSFMTDVGHGVGSFTALAVTFWLTGGTGSTTAMLGAGAGQQERMISEAKKRTEELRGVLGDYLADDIIEGMDGLKADGSDYSLEEDMALLTGAIGEAALEKFLGVEKLLGTFPSKFRSSLVRILASTGAEGVTEGLQQLTQNSVAKLFYDAEQGVFDDVAYEALIGAIIGGGAATLTGSYKDGTLKIVHSKELQLRRQLADIEQKLEALQATRLAVEESQTFQMDPIAVRSVLEGSGDTKVSLPADEVDALYQDGFISQEDLEAMQVNDDIQQMVNLGADIEVPASVLLTLPNSDFDQISRHVRVSPEMPTQAEAQAALAAQDEEVARLTAELQATLNTDLEGVDKAVRVQQEVKSIAPIIEDQIVSALNIPREEAGPQASLIANRYAVRADDMDNVTALQLLEADQLEFQRGQAPQAPQAPMTQAPTMEQPTVQDTVRVDNPEGEWLENKIRYAEEDAAAASANTATANFLSGSVTAYTRQPVMLPVPELDQLKGAMGEETHRVAGQPKFDALAEQVEAEGFKMDAPILIGINHKGDPYIIEGNHRVAVAAATGVPAIPAEVKWFNGAEQTAQFWTPDMVTKWAQPVPTMGQAPIDTKSPEFQAWFGDSKVMDEAGEPLVVYHGTRSKRFEVFSVAPAKSARETAERDAAQAFFFSDDRSVASTYTEAEGRVDKLKDAVGLTDPRVEDVYLNIRRPFVLDMQGKPYNEDVFYDTIVAAKDGGYDGVLFKDVQDALNETDTVSDVWGVFRPEQIKSVSAQRFDPTSPNIFEQPALDLFTTPLPIEGRTTIKKLGEALTERHQRLVGRQLFPEESETDFNIVLDSAVQEVAEQITRPNSGLGWYSADVDTALHDTARIFPTLLENEGDRNLYLTFAGIFSSGMDPDQAWMTAALAFDGYIASGQIPLTRSEAADMAGRDIETSTFKDRKTGETVTKEKGWGVRSTENTKALTAFKYLVEREGGVEAATRWLMERQERSAINEVMLESGAYKSGRFVTKKAKAGDPEFGALIFGPKLGRYTIGLFGVPVRAEDTTIDLWYTRTFRRLTGRLLEGPLSKEGVAGEPANDTERAAIFRLTGAIADHFKITNGDAQALLWFFEKRLYGEHGVTIKEGTNSDGAKRLAAARGLTAYDRTGGVGQSDLSGTGAAIPTDLGAGVRGTSAGRATFRGHPVTALRTYGGARPVTEIAESDVFADLITRAKDELGAVGAQVTVYDDYSADRMFIFDDGYSGFALRGDDIISVFSVPRKAPKGAVKRLMEVAVAEGGLRLDAFDTFLPKVYARAGFKAVAKLPFSREYAPDGWDYAHFEAEFPETKGEPPVVFMAYDPPNAAATTDNVVADYDEGISAQTDAITPLILEQGPRGAYVAPTLNNRQNLIWLSDQADLSTLLHETGHMFLFQLMQDANDSRLKKDAKVKHDQMVASIRNWFGDNVGQAKKDLADMKRQLKKRIKDEQDASRKQMLENRLAAIERVDPNTLKAAAQAFMDPTIDGYNADAEVLFHELWARGFEKYLAEGKAPTKSLKRAFQKFSAWLVGVYKQMTNLNVELSPEIRDVFDHLVAIDEAIQGEQRSPVYKVPSEVLELATASELRTLTRLVDEAELEGRSQMQNRQARVFQQEERDKRRAERQALEEQIAPEIAAEPAHAAVKIARDQTMPDGTEIKDAKPMDLAEVEALIGKARAEALPVGMATRGTKKGKAMPAADVAALAGFETDVEMLNAVTSMTETEEQAVRRAVDAAMPPAPTTAELNEDAAASLQNDKFAELQTLQMRILRKATSTEMEKVARREAETEGVGDVQADRDAQTEAQAQTGPEALLARLKADTQRKVNIGHRRAQAAAKKKLRTIRRGIEPANINAAADAFVDQLVVGDATAGRYRQSAERLTTKIEQAIAGRDYTTAASLMEQRALLLAVSRRVAEFQSKSQRQLKSYREFTGRSDKKLSNSYNVDYVNAIRAALSPFDMARSAAGNYDAGKALAELKQTEPELYNEIAQTIELWQLKGQTLNGRDRYKQLTVAEFNDVIEMADMLKTNSRAAAGMLAEGRRVAHGQIAAEINRNADNIKAVEKREDGRSQYRGSEWSRWLTEKRQSIAGSLRIVESWSRMADRDNVAGPLTTYLVRPIMEAVDTYSKNRVEPQQVLLDMVLNRKDLGAKRKIDAPELDGWQFQSKGEVLHFVLHMGNDSNKFKLLMGGAKDISTGQQFEWGSQNEDGTVNDERAMAFLNRMFAEEILTKEDMDLVQGIWDIFEETKKAAQAAHKRMYGYNFTEVEATPLVTPFGTYAGGYVPAIRDALMDENAAKHEAEMISSDQQNTYMFPTVERGFTKSRIHGAFGPMRLELSSIPAHFDRVMKFAYLAPTVRDAARMVTHPEVGAAINRISPAYVQNGLIPWLQTVASQRVITPSEKGDWVSSVATTLSRRVGLHLMMGNVVNAAEQVTGFAPAAVRVGAGNLAKAAGRWRVDGQKARAYVSSRSEAMAQRMLNSTNEAMHTTIDILSDKSKISKVEHFSAKYGYFLQQGVQNIMDPIIWLAAEQKAMKTVYPEVYAKELSISGDEALAAEKADSAVVFWADQVVRETQASMRAADLANINIGTGSKRLFLKFFQWFSSMQNLQLTEHQINWNRDNINWGHKMGRSFYVYLMTFFVPMVGSEALRMLLSGDFDDLDDEEDVLEAGIELLAGSQIRGALAMVPYAGPVAGAAYGAFTDEVYDNRINMGAPLGMLESSTVGIARMVMAATDPDTDVNERSAIRSMLTAFSLATGLPSNWLAKPLGYATKVHAGEADPEGLADLIQGAITGRDGTE